VIAVPEPIIEIPTPEIVGNDIVPVLSETRIDTPAPGKDIGRVRLTGAVVFPPFNEVKFELVALKNLIELANLTSKKLLPEAERLSNKNCTAALVVAIPTLPPCT
jgi:hypothetical protein